MKIYALCYQDARVLSYHWHPPYDELKGQDDIYNIRVFDSTKHESTNADRDVIQPEWEPFHGKFTQYQHLYDFIDRDVAQLLEKRSLLGQLNEPIEHQFDISEVWEKGKCKTDHAALDELREHYYNMVGIYNHVK